MMTTVSPGPGSRRSRSPCCTGGWVTAPGTMPAASAALMVGPQYTWMACFTRPSAGCQGIWPRQKARPGHSTLTTASSGRAARSTTIGSAPVTAIIWRAARAASSSSVRQGQPSPAVIPAQLSARPSRAGGLPGAPGGGYRRPLMSSRAPGDDRQAGLRRLGDRPGQRDRRIGVGPRADRQRPGRILRPQPRGEPRQAEATRARLPPPATPRQPRIRATSSAHQPPGTVPRSRNRRSAGGVAASAAPASRSASS